MKAKPFFTRDDYKVSFSLFCAIFGIGTLGMPSNFSRAGPYLATVALVFMAFANTYSSVAICKVMLAAPRTVKTFGDLGEYSMGRAGRYLALISQLASLLMIPCAFLVLGGMLLGYLFPGAFSNTTWICLMATMVFPVCMVPTLKDGAGTAFAGCLSTLIADIIGVAVLMHGMAGHPSPPSPHLTFKQVATTFGNLSLAYGAGIIIPTLQRQHSDPSRMPRAVGVTMSVISVLFLLLAGLGYSAVGCQISGNLLFTIYPDAETGLTALGFTANWGTIVVAYLCMQVHITIAFSVVMSPTFYLLERALLGMHKKVHPDLQYETINTPAAEKEDEDLESRVSKSSVTDAVESEADEFIKERSEYQGANTVKYITMRVVVVVLLVIVSVALEDQFLDLTDFIGASSLTVNSILLPIIFYLKQFWPTIPLYEKVVAFLVMLVCLCLGVYVTYTSGKALFENTSSSVTFPFCEAEYQNTIYYVKNS